MGWCKYCAKNRATEKGDEGFIVCTVCGRVTDADVFSTEVTFIKGAGGQSQMSGNFVKSVESEYSESRERTLMKGRDEISYLVTSLNVGGGNSIIDEASRFYKIAVEKDFTRGRRTSLVAAACLYIACRENKKAFLLIDFSEELRINVYVLGAVFLQLCQLLRLEEHPIVQKPVDPSLFIHRFTERLLGGKNVEVSRTALRILASMKRDWMQTGRKPSGLCGAALYISALSQGLKFSKSDIGRVVHICEATLTKRLIEFENTSAAGLTIEEFNLKAEELEREARKLPYTMAESSGKAELLCEHKGSGESHFAHGLCRTCYDDFIELSGGLSGGSEPPAFQRAERERMDQSCSAEKAKGSSLPNDEIEPCSEPIEDVVENEKLSSQWSKNSDAANEHQTADEGATFHSHGHENVDDTAGDKSESLSDIDDDEVDGYLHTEDEKRRKGEIWEEINKEYEEEQRLKKAMEDAAKKAYEENYKNLSEDSRALLMELEAANAKKRKERQQKRAADAKNAVPAQNATEAARGMVSRKKLSSRINYDVLSGLFDDSKDPENPIAPENTKKKRIESDSNDADTQQKEEKELESDLQDDGIDMDEEGAYDEEYNGVTYGDEVEEYGYDGDYGGYDGDDGDEY